MTDDSNLKEKFTFIWQKKKNRIFYIIYTHCFVYTYSVALHLCARDLINENLGK